MTLFVVSRSLPPDQGVSRSAFLHFYMEGRASCVRVRVITRMRRAELGWGVPLIQKPTLQPDQPAFLVVCKRLDGGEGGGKGRKKRKYDQDTLVLSACSNFYGTHADGE